MPNELLPAEFYQREITHVARDLLGQRLVRLQNGQRIAGIISEVEAYGGPEDLASHARFGRTRRNAAMWGPPGLAYVYLIYGMYWCLNAVTGQEGQPSAALIRAIQPTEGLDLIAARRAGVKTAHWTDGPGKICQALEITGSLNGALLTDSTDGLWIEAGEPVPDAIVLSGTRVGVESAPEPWRSMPWRFRIRPAKKAGS